MRLRTSNSIAANPTLIGAATVLVTVVAVFLAYNANAGLPLVPSYDVNVEVGDAARLTAGNEVRISGRRAGQVRDIIARTTRSGRPYARLKVRLDQTVDPLPVDSTARVRPRSTLGLKYLELTPGRSKRTVKQGGRLALRQARGRVELDQVLQAFDSESRRDLTSAVADLSTGLAGRGGDVNRMLGDLRPVLNDLVPVAATLADPATELDGMVDGLARATETLSPVAPALADLIVGADTTLRAAEDERPALDATLAAAPETVITATRALDRITPVLDDGAALLEEVRPGTRLLPSAASGLSDLARRGAPVLQRATALGPDLQDTLEAVGRLVDERSTLGSVKRLTAVVARLGPTLRAVNPFQVECNYLGLWTRNASSTISEGDELGTWFRFIPIYQPPEIVQSARPAPELHVTPYGRVDGECETGNEPFEPGQRIGNPPGAQPATTEDTAPPPGLGGAR